jgi:beta-phosphoglucomutase
MRSIAIFDLDGVITSTTDAHFKAWNALFEATYDITLDPSLEMLTRGVSRITSLKTLLDHHGIREDEETIRMLAKEKNAHYRTLIEGFTTDDLLPGAIFTIRLLKDMGCHIALASASRNAPFLLDRLGISDLFSYVSDPSGHRGKPHPDLFEAPMRHFGMKPEDCVGFEDARAGIEAIKAAGMYAVGVGDTVLERADIHVRTLADLGEERLRHIIGGEHHGKRHV